MLVKDKFGNCLGPEYCRTFSDYLYVVVVVVCVVVLLLLIVVTGV